MILVFPKGEAQPSLLWGKSGGGQCSGHLWGQCPSGRQGWQCDQGQTASLQRLQRHPTPGGLQKTRAGLTCIGEKVVHSGNLPPHSGPANVAFHRAQQGQLRWQPGFFSGHWCLPLFSHRKGHCQDDAVTSMQHGSCDPIHNSQHKPPPSRLEGNG